MEATSAPFTIGRASVTREADSDAGDPIYLTRIEAVATEGTKSATLDLQLRHSDTAAGYVGRLRYTIEAPFGESVNCPDGAKMAAVSLAYEKASGADIRYRIQRAMYCAVVADPFEADGSLDPDAWSQDFNEALINLDPADGGGVFAYAWQAGSGDDNTRVFLAELAADAEGVLSGCGYFGFGPPIGDPDVGSIDGMICNWAGPGNVHVPEDKLVVQRQCVSFDAAEKVYVSDPERLRITYAPVNACDSENPFEFGGVTGLVTNDLLPLAEMTSAFTPPVEPATL
jgi:hypothetical protein